ncbi:hypothetical protein PAP_04535 [Palaeococcus pacificus DY20341]|uniref:CheR-type methyltransferase domain-containing protein n=1 Tax=Palaeococcus pacificus DY20341 TaxID=1343739 RepID=A0A075LXN0_9EURY|nr:protein-glutamate O-methyltransferase CheR [Palaeococcus pacificus]AIF69318.1 hypothetical protein PAP_04535 [Palaeococcus pacificus DY20341]
MQINNGYQLIKKELSKYLNLEDNAYKETYLLRRISVRARKLGFSNNLLDYYQFLKKNKEEIEELLLTITINTSEFFRDPILWKTLQNKIFPELIKNKQKSGSNSIRIWSAACSYGQEPYSIAMTLYETLGPDLKGFKISILATDIDTQALANAIAGTYPENALDKIPAKLREKYFIQEKNRYKVKNSLKQLVKFKTFNLLSFPYPKGFDIIFLRNVLIYMTRQSQEKIFKNIYRSLQEDGYLILGTTESILGESSRLFKIYNLKARIYKKNLELVRYG